MIELLDPDLLCRPVEEGPVGRHVMVYRETTSTNDLVLRMGEHGEAEGIVVFAERQTAGRGRFRRAWHSADGLGLWFSLLLRRTIPDLTLLTPFVAVSVAEALAGFAGEAIALKAPNDVFGRRGKLAGILIEARSGSRPFSVVGIGININHQLADLPEGVEASSLALEMGARQDRTAVAQAVLRHLNRRLPELDLSPPPFLPLYEEFLARRKHAVSLQPPEI